MGKEIEAQKESDLNTITHLLGGEGGLKAWQLDSRAMRKKIFIGSLKDVLITMSYYHGWNIQAFPSELPSHNSGTQLFTSTSIYVKYCTYLAYAPFCPIPSLDSASWVRHHILNFFNSTSLSMFCSEQTQKNGANPV